MILGIISVVSSPCCGFISVPLAIGAVATGIIALTQLKAAPQQQGKGQAVAGIACGGAAILIFVALIIFQLTTFGFSTY
jgi:hypothetical protein